MQPKNTLLFVFLMVVACAITAYFSFSSGEKSAETTGRKEYERAIDSLNQRMKVLQTNYNTVFARQQFLQLKLDSAGKRDSALKLSYDKTVRDLAGGQQRYETLKRFENMSSDEIRAYFNQHFKDSIQ